jgi:alginate O-acetyltransferase complex protein AlgJ
MNRVLVLLFAIAIVTPAVGTIFGVDTGRLPGENRALARPPDFGVAPVKELRRQIDAWFDDHFGFRSTLVTMHSLVEYAVFGVSSSNKVVIGRDGWLFYAADRIIENRRGLLPFTADELRVWQAKLEERRDWLAHRGIRYVFAVAPEKSSLYAELLPATLQPVQDGNRADQLFEWMRAHSTVEMLDFRPALRAAKDDERLYHRTDTHWNDLGAFIAYHEVAAWLARNFPSVRPRERDEFEREVKTTGGGDLAGMLALVPYLPEERIALVARTPSPLLPEVWTEVLAARASFDPRVYANPAGEIARAVVVHDSFFQPLQPFLAPHFRRSVFLKRLFAGDVIRDEQPDVVVEEVVERVLSRPGFVLESELGDAENSEQ